MSFAFYSGDGGLPGDVLRLVQKMERDLSHSDEGRALLSQRRVFSGGDFLTIVEALKEVESSVQKFPAFNDLQDVNVVIYSTTDHKIKGLCLSPNVFVLFKAAQHHDHRTVFAHELYHMVRGRAQGTPRTLGEHLVEEGLANVFCYRDVLLEPPPLFLTKPVESVWFYNKSLRPYVAAVKDKMGATDFDKLGIFFGNETYPQYFGYNLGLVLADSWLHHSHNAAADVIHVSARDIYQPWLDKKFPLKGEVERVGRGCGLGSGPSP